MKQSRISAGSGNAGSGNAGSGNAGSLGVDLALGVWFLLVGLVFWSPYLGLSLPIPAMTAVYGLFLLLFIAAIALRLLRQNQASAEVDDAAGAQTVKQTTERIPHRGE